jgi:hypothetical protein
MGIDKEQRLSFFVLQHEAFCSGYLGTTSNSTFNGIGSLNMDSTGQFASVLRQAASNSSFLAAAHTLVFTVTPVNTGESGDFSASATASTLMSSILLCLQTSANIVTAQSAKAIIANSLAVGPVSFPPAAVERSQTTLCVLELSTTDRTFSIHLAVALNFGIFFTEENSYAGDKLKVAQPQRAMAQKEDSQSSYKIFPL